MTLSLDHSLAVREDALFRDLDGEGIILDLASGRYFGVDGVGARIWKLLRGGATLREIHQQLLGEFDVASDVLEHDLLRFAGDMVSRGLAVAA